jgi:transcriptional regulator with XRE-family HTH domain
MHGDDQTDRMQELGRFIRDRRRASRLSLRRLSARSGISNPYLSQIERGLRKPSAEILQQIARALEIATEELYVRAGILDSHSDRGLVEHIRRDPLLTDDQKQALESLYRSFRAEAAALAGDEAPGRAGK